MSAISKQWHHMAFWGEHMCPSDSGSGSVVFFYPFLFTALKSPDFKPQFLISAPGEAAGSSPAVPEQALQYSLSCQRSDWDSVQFSSYRIGRVPWVLAAPRTSRYRHTLHWESGDPLGSRVSRWTTPLPWETDKSSGEPWCVEVRSVRWLHAGSRCVQNVSSLWHDWTRRTVPWNRKERE